jgi:hypothetical protein
MEKKKGEEAANKGKKEMRTIEIKAYRSSVDFLFVKLHNHN